MVDHVSQKKRSEMMSAVHNKGNLSTEMRLRELLLLNKIIGWRINASDILGKPDFVFDREKLVIFVDGCFWHGCKKHKSLPKTNIEYWKTKIETNILRDNRVRRRLRRQGWHVIRFWEHQLKSNPSTIIRKIMRKINRD